MNSDLYRIKLSTGTVYQTSKDGNYYFRYQVNGERKCVSLKTANQEEAIRKAKEFIPTVQASSLEVIASHVKVARKLAAQAKSLPLTKIWETYAAHPQRALPATVREQLSYEATLAEFLRFMGNKVKQFSQINETHTMKFADYLRTTQISVSTHNRKIVRLRKIFNTLHDVPEDKTVARYYRCLEQIKFALPYLNRAYFFDNSSTKTLYFAEYELSKGFQLHSEMIPDWFNKFVLG